jgi:hypothetical protein
MEKTHLLKKTKSCKLRLPNAIVGQRLTPDDKETRRKQQSKGQGEVVKGVFKMSQSACVKEVDTPRKQ